MINAHHHKFDILPISKFQFFTLKPQGSKIRTAHSLEISAGWVIAGYSF